MISRRFADRVVCQAAHITHQHRAGIATKVVDEYKLAVQVGTASDLEEV